MFDCFTGTESNISGLMSYILHLYYQAAIARLRQVGTSHNRCTYTSGQWLQFSKCTIHGPYDGLCVGPANREWVGIGDWRRQPTQADNQLGWALTRLTYFTVQRTSVLSTPGYFQVPCISGGYYSVGNYTPATISTQTLEAIR